MSFPGQTSGPSLFTYRPDVNLGDEAHVVELAAMAQIRQNLEQECARVDAAWVQRDKDLAPILSMAPFAPTTITRVQPANFFVGARPSLIGSPPDFWPSVTTRAARAQWSKEQMDQIDVFDVTLYVEVLCKAGPVAQDRLHLQDGIVAEGEVNKQVQRLSAAVHNTMRLDPTLGRTINGLTNTNKQQGYPTALPGNTTERTGDYYLYCGKQLRYTATLDAY